MAFVLRQERSPCTPQCGCNNMAREEIVKYGVSDDGYLAFIQQYRSIPPVGMLFKYPPAAPRSELHQPQTLYEMSFKILATLSDNAARRHSCLDEHSLIFDWHFTQLKQLKGIFIHQFGIPTNIADAILPRLFVRHRYSSVFEALNLMMDVHQHIDYHHHTKDFEKYYRLRF